MTARQIEKDLLRTLPTNVCFTNINSTGIPRLRRILRGLAWLYPDIGYCQVKEKPCILTNIMIFFQYNYLRRADLVIYSIFVQGMGMIVAIFLLLMEEEDAFWMMTAVIEEILPPSYYSPRYTHCSSI